MIIIHGLILMNNNDIYVNKNEGIYLAYYALVGCLAECFNNDNNKVARTPPPRLRYMPPQTTAQ